MDKSIYTTIPAQLQSSYFYNDEQVLLELGLLKNIDQLVICEQFQYEIAHYQGYQCEKPWNNDKVAVSKLMAHWPSIEKKLAQHFEDRQKSECAELMKLGIAIFIQSLFWTNNIPTTLTDIITTVEKLQWKPINVGERLEFILSRPHFHHSFIQLSELMKELEKQYYIKNI